MKARTHDAYYDYVKARADRLTPTQMANVAQRVRTVKARVAPWTWLMAIDSCIDIELAGNSPVPQCPPVNSQELKFADLLRGACFVEHVMNPYESPNKIF